MIALAIVAVALLLILGLLARDRKKVAHDHAIERGLQIVSARSSRRLQVRMPVRSDKDFFIAMASDPIAAEANGWSGNEPNALQNIFANRAKFTQFRQNELVAFERATSTRVGTATFSTSPVGPAGSRSIGIHVRADHRNKGYGREVMAAAIALMQFTPEPVWVGTHVDNIGIQKIMLQLGFDPEPAPRTYVAPNGREYQAVWYPCGADIHPPAGLFDG